MYFENNVDAQICRVRNCINLRLMCATQVEAPIEFKVKTGSIMSHGHQNKTFVQLLVNRLYRVS